MTNYIIVGLGTHETHTAIWLVAMYTNFQQCQAHFNRIEEVFHKENHQVKEIEKQIKALGLDPKIDAGSTIKYVVRACKVFDHFDQFLETNGY